MSTYLLHRSGRGSCLQCDPVLQRSRLCCWLFQWALAVASARSNGNHQYCSLCSPFLQFINHLYTTLWFADLQLGPGDSRLTALQINEILYIESLHLLNHWVLWYANVDLPGERRHVEVRVLHTSSPSGSLCFKSHHKEGAVLMNNVPYQ